MLSGVRVRMYNPDSLVYDNQRAWESDGGHGTSRHTQFAELVALIKEVSPPSRIESLLSNIKMKMPIICVYPPVTMEAEEVERLELMVGERCNDMLLDTGLFIVGAVCGRSLHYKGLYV